MTTRKELELYIHIPFCVKKCNYCDFLSFFAGANEREQYVQALLQQIEKQKVVAQTYEVTTIFIGGGTPSLLEIEQMQRIFMKLHEIFRIRQEAEITIEINPATVTKRKMQSYRKMGINRLSIGLQSANEVELQLLGRIHTYQEFYSTFLQAREAEFTNINIDFISAIPGQSVASWKDNLEKVVSLEPEHISVYSLMIEEGTPFYEWYGDNGMSPPYGVAAIPSEDELLKMDELTESILAKHAYVRYEISNYAKKGYACAHNLGYWDRKEYMGLGLGAASYINGIRLKNTSNMSDYLKNAEAVEDRHVLSVEEQMEEFCFLGLRKMQGISEVEFQEQFGKSLQKVYAQEIEMLQKEGLLIQEQTRFHLTKRGAELGNYVFEQFIMF